MIIVEPKITVPYIDGVEIMKNIEKAGRTCYKSEVKTDDSYKTFIKNCIKSGHESVIEHEKITVRLIADRGVMWDITRHRICNFSIESTRFCNYSKDKFGKEIKVIRPFFFDGEKDPKYKAWEDAIKQSEKSYFEILDNGGIPDYARMVLPASLATEICMTANIREWRHIFSLRCQKTAHPHVRQIMIPLLLHFKEKMPELFEDITYDTEFAEKYKNDLAKIECELTDLQKYVADQLYNTVLNELDEEVIGDNYPYFAGYSSGYNEGKKDILCNISGMIYSDKVNK